MAEEQEKILVEVDYSSVEEYAAAAVQARKKLEEMRKANKALKESGEATAEQIEASNAAVRNAQKEYKNTTLTLDKMTAAQKANGTSYDDLYKQWQAAERKLKSLEGTIIKNADGTYTLSEEYKKAAEEVANAKEALNQFTTGVKDGRNNVGLYSDAINEAFGGLSGQLSSAIPGFAQLQQGINAAKVGFTSLRGAIMATGIGALVILIISLVQYLTKTKEGANFLAKSMAVLGAVFDTLMSVLKPLGQSLVSVFTEPKKQLNDLLDILKGQVINRFNGFGKILQGIWKIMKGDFSEGLKLMGEGAVQATTGVENLGAKVKALAEEALKAAKAAADLADAQADLDQANVDATRSLADLQRQAEKYKQIADDATRSLDERTKAADLADRAERAMQSKRVELAREAYRIASLELAQQKKRGNDTIEVQQKAAEAYAALREAETSYTTAINDNGKRRREIELDYLELRLDSIEKGFEAVKAANVSVIGNDQKTVAERRVILESLTKTRNEAFAQEIALLEKQTKKSIDLADLAASKDSVELDQKLKRLGLSEKATIRLQDIVKNQIDTSTEFAELQRTLDEKALARKQAFDAKERELIDAATTANREALNARATQELEIGAQLLKNKAEKEIKNADERSLKLQQIEISKAQALRDIALNAQAEADRLAEQQRNDKAVADIAALQVEADQKAQLLADNEALNQQNIAAIAQAYDLQRQANAAQTEAEITANQKFEIELRKKALQGTVQVAADVFGTMADLVGKQTAIGKAFAITQAIINTYSSAVAAYNSAAQIPFVGYILGPVAAGAAIAAGLKNVQAIKSASTGGGAAGGGNAGSGQTISASFTAASPRVASSQAAASAQNGAASTQQDVAAAKAGDATAEALRKNPPTLYVDTFEAKQAEKNAIQVKANF